MHWKLNLFVFAANLIAAGLLLFIFSPAFGLLNMINYVFYVGLFYLIIFIAAFVMRGGFFDAITHSFRKVAHRLAPSRPSNQGWEQRLAPSEVIQTSFFRVLFFQTVSLIVLDLLLLAVYYAAN
ncbi:DUF3899 domain-containing protein [Marinococcus sp. PL1-022]|uniref:DUF3899 domain-containing protein n=1 Tax=Marinococcus sp. PL1-022 TaxID=3095363 RepID=UPI0029C2E8DE|nr:DUF3899 domain-containing protein [Marinococcus sp. PL1-022]MDX6154371.1 DUF3899 domain-containing protein [Marinococcus sp. PL1-022]